jgi:hypothetical protein
MCIVQKVQLIFWTVQLWRPVFFCTPYIQLHFCMSVSYIMLQLINLHAFVLRNTCRIFGVIWTRPYKRMSEPPGSKLYRDITCISHARNKWYWGLPVPGQNTIGRQVGIKPLTLHISKRRETNHNQDCITESSKALNPSRALYIYTRIMHEMGNHSWYTIVTLRLKGNTASSYQSKDPNDYKQRSLTQYYITQRKEVMLLDIARITWPKRPEV